MYFFVIMVCLQGEPQCVPLVEDPPVYYETVKECEASLHEKGMMIAKALDDEKVSGTMAGQCLKDETVTPT